MKKTLKRLAKISLTVSLFGCADFPKISPHIIRIKDGKCGEYEIIRRSNACDISYKFKQWHPLERCEGYFALSPDDVTKLREYQAAECNKDSKINGNTVIR